MTNTFQLNSNNIEESSCSIFKYAVLLEYDGTHFYGSQIQPDHRTVQQEIETAFKTIFKQDVKITMAGRTDTGVHSIGQVAHFEIDESIDTTKTCYSLNGLLPHDISIRALQPVDQSFNARKSATKRWYRFSIYNHKFRSALNTKCLYVHKPLDVNLMHEALQPLIGTHEFDSFKSSNSDNPNTRCTIYKAQCLKNRDFIYIDLIANRFLCNMVRIIVGTLLKVGNKEENADYLRKILEAKNRNKAGITVKPDGLTLMAIEYPEKFNIFIKDSFFKVSDLLQGNFTEAQNEDLLCKAS